MTTAVRDSERQMTYDAEYSVRRVLEMEGQRMVVHGTTLTIPVERRFGTLESVQTYVDLVLTLNWVQRDYPRAEIPVTVRKRRGDTAAHYERWNSVIAVPDKGYGLAGWAMREIVILHELAHHLQDDGGGHTASFRGIFATFVTEIISPEIGWLLMVRFQEQGLQVV